MVVWVVHCIVYSSVGILGLLSVLSRGGAGRPGGVLSLAPSV